MDASRVIEGIIAIFAAAIGAFYGTRLRDLSKRREGAIAALPEYYASAATAWYVHGEYQRTNWRSPHYAQVEQHYWESYHRMLAANTALAAAICSARAARHPSQMTQPQGRTAVALKSSLVSITASHAAPLRSQFGNAFVLDFDTALAYPLSTFIACRATIETSVLRFGSERRQDNDP
jgi:hypothetical protein